MKELTLEEMKELNAYFNKYFKELQVEKFIYRGKRVDIEILSVIMTQSVNYWIKERNKEKA
jgi:hypothetical protein